MALSVVELDEDDCGTNYGFTITVLNEKHGKSLIGKYYKLNASEDWKLFTSSDIHKYINTSLIFRSPITCFNNHYKICKKCFGYYPRIQTPFVGVISGQVVSEKTTQLTLRSFHTSGSSTLAVNNKLKNYIRSHLVDIELQELSCKLIFDDVIPDEFIEIINTIPGFQQVHENICEFDYIYNVENEDVGKVIKELKNCLLTEKGDVICTLDTYNRLIESILSVGNIFSSFIEIILCNLYTNNKNKIIRYQLRDNEILEISKKYSVYHIHSLLSPTLNLLYKPNLNTISEYYNTIVKNNHKPSIFEKIWLDI
jgi:hypothetical protein